MFLAASLDAPQQLQLERLLPGFFSTSCGRILLSCPHSTRASGKHIKCYMGGGLIAAPLVRLIGVVFSGAQLQYFGTVSSFLAFLFTDVADSCSGKPTLTSPSRYLSSTNTYETAFAIYC